MIFGKGKNTRGGASLGRSGMARVLKWFHSAVSTQFGNIAAEKIWQQMISFFVIISNLCTNITE